jgi:hypothetical protein
VKTTGVELHEILVSEAGAAFFRDYCDGDDDVAYAAIALVHNPSAYKHWIEEKDKGDRSKKPPS